MKKLKQAVLVFGAVLVSGLVGRGQVIQDRPASSTPPPILTITGTVFDPSSVPAPGVALLLAPDNTSLGGPFTSDANGRYTVRWRAPQPSRARDNSAFRKFMDDPRNNPHARDSATLECMIVARDPGRNLVAVQTIDAMTTNLDLHLQPGLTLFTKVVEPDGSPIPNATPYLNIARDASFSLFIPKSGGNSDAQGRLQIPALPQGFRCSFNAGAPGHGPAVVNFIPETETQTNRLELPPFVLKPANLKLAGQVLDADGKPSPNTRVTTYGMGQPGLTVQTDVQGRFELKVCEGPVSLNATLKDVTGITQATGGDADVVVRLAAPRR